MKLTHCAMLFAAAFAAQSAVAAVETPAAGLYRVLTDLCLDRYLRDKDLNDAQLNTGRPLICALRLHGAISVFLYGR